MLIAGARTAKIRMIGSKNAMLRIGAAAAAKPLTDVQNGRHSSARPRCGIVL
jgi:hypothetical protein